MSDDVELSQRLTRVARETPGVAAVFPAKPIVAAAADAVAVALQLREPDVLVDIDRSGGSTTVTAQIGTSADRPAPDVVRAAGERLRDAVRAEVDGELVVHVTVRLVERGAARADEG